MWDWFRNIVMPYYKHKKIICQLGGDAMLYAHNRYIHYTQGARNGGQPPAPPQPPHEGNNANGIGVPHNFVYQPQNTASPNISPQISPHIFVQLFNENGIAGMYGGIYGGNDDFAAGLGPRGMDPRNQNNLGPCSRLARQYCEAILRIQDRPYAGVA